MPQLERLSTDRRIALLDLPGYGLAAGWTVPDTLVGFSEQVHRALAARFPGPVTVVGHSFGGYVALQLYRDHPNDFAGLVLTNTRSTPDPEEARSKRLATVERLRDPAEHLDPDEVTKSLVAPMAWSGQGPLVGTVRGMVGHVASTTIIATLQAIAGRPDLSPVLPRITVPTCVVWGEQDRLIPPELSRAMLPLIPRSVGVGIPDAGHLPSLESPERFGRAVRSLGGPGP
jgi:3-oxoadipate enol-lactonase